MKMKKLILVFGIALTSCYKPMTCECKEGETVTGIATTEWMTIHRKQAEQACQERQDAMDEGTVCTLLD
jgi:(p)ppGpp synthase/HD superfamily hydrolase